MFFSWCLGRLLDVAGQTRKSWPASNGNSWRRRTTQHRSEDIFENSMEDFFFFSMARGGSVVL